MSAREGERVLCRTPAPGKKPTRILRWKYEVVRRAILASLPESEPGLPFKDLSRFVGRQLSQQEQDELGSIGWYTTTVKLDMETRGEIKRIGKSSPQRLIRLVHE